jgi:outer membrane protein assembly factor BamB
LLFTTKVLQKIARHKQIPPPGKARIALTIVLFSSFVLLAGWVLNRYWLPHKLHPLSLAIDAGLIAAMAALGWITLFAGRAKALVLMGAAGLCVLLFSLTTISLQDENRDHSPSLKNLSALPYLTWVPVDAPGESSGVVYHEESESFAGLNLYNSRNLATAHLMDMSGENLHSWSAKIDGDDGWFDTELYKKSDLLAIVKDKTLMRLDWNSNVVWSVQSRFHHDITVGDDDTIYALSRKDELRSVHHMPVPVLNDYIMVVSERGGLIKEIPLFRILKDEISIRKLARFYLSLINPLHQWDILRLKTGSGHFFKEDWPSDLLHTNTAEMIHRDVDDVFKKGRLLYCSRVLDLIGVIDVETESMVWTWGQGILDGPHHPTLLENGNILIFDNGAFRRGYSRVIELDPRANTIVWEYKSDPPEKFFSITRGASQRLPNGNTLITNSDSGLAFEIAPDGTTVWEFRNPVVLDGKYRAAIYRLTRIIDRDYGQPTK